MELWKFAELPKPKQPLLQKLLAACYARVHPESKTEPCEFDWSSISPAKLGAYEKHRKQKKGHSGRGSPGARKLAALRWRTRNTAKTAEYHKKWRKTEQGLRYEDRRAQQHHTQALQAQAEARAKSTDVTALPWREIANPTYIVEEPDGTQTVERWPLHDQAALIIASSDTRNAVPPPLPPK